MTERTQKHWFARRDASLTRLADAAILVVLLLAGCTRAEFGLEFPGSAPGLAQGKISRSELVLENKVLACTWDISEGRLKPRRITDKLSATTLQLRETECFQLVLGSGRVVKASDLKIVGKPELKNLKPKSKSFRLAEQFGGKQITVILASSDDNLKVQWRAILRDSSNYVRQQVVFTTKNKAVEIREIVLLELVAPQAEVMGTVDGSPVVAGNMFFAYEHPLSKNSKFEISRRRRGPASFPLQFALQHPAKAGWAAGAKLSYRRGSTRAVTPRLFILYRT